MAAGGGCGSARPGAAILHVGSCRVHGRRREKHCRRDPSRFRPTGMSTSRTFVAVLVLLGVATAASAARDWDGGAIRSLRVSAARLRISGTITRAGVHHDSLVGASAPFHFELVDADDASTVLYEVDIPADQFATRGTR